MSIKEKYRVLPIERSDYKEWILHKHYAKRMPSISYAFGLFDNENIIQGVCTYGSPPSPSLCIGVCGANYKSIVVELNRLCLNDKIINGASFLVAKTLKMLPSPLIIVSYADTSQNHHGYIYQATNFIYTGATKKRTDIGFEDGTHSRHYSKTINPKANRKVRTSKHRYIYFIGSKSEKKKMLASLNYEIKQYPKGDNQRYDATYEPTLQPLLF